MVTGSERKALETVSPETGETTCHLIGKKMGIDSGYARVLCGNLVRNHYLAPVGSGRYEITPMGRKALRWEHGKGQENDFERLPQEDFAWQRVSPRNGNGDKPQLEKPGQEDWSWSPARIERFPDPASSRGNGVSSGIMAPGTYACGYCKGKGKRANRGRCPVCGGTGEVKIPVASIRCAFCKGRGEAKPRTDHICTVCRGTGLVRVAGPVAVCPECRGRGMRVGSELPCLGCGGKGFVRANRVSGKRGTSCQ